MQRRHPRYDYEVRVSHRQLDSDKNGMIRNISEGGLMAEFPELFPPGTPLTLLIPLGERFIRAMAEVVWSKEFPDAAGIANRHGLKFTHLTLQDRLTLKLFLAEELS